MGSFNRLFLFFSFPPLYPLNLPTLHCYPHVHFNCTSFFSFSLSIVYEMTRMQTTYNHPPPLHACNRATLLREIWPGFAERAYGKVGSATLFQFTGVPGSFARNIRLMFDTFGDLAYVSSDLAEQPDDVERDVERRGPPNLFFVL